MPQIPVLIPIIVTGLLVGSVMVNEGRKMSKKRLGTASVISGLLNGAQAYLVNYFLPQTTVRTGTITGGGTFPGAGTFTGTATFTGAAAVRQTSELTYTVSSIVVGILIPLAILGIAMFRSRSRGGEEEMEPEDSALEK
jgi:uncharacterized YccA/Bax inhibitor family protein